MKSGVKASINLTYLLSVVFFFSGFASLVYQVAWQRLLTVYYGVGTISITLIVSVYMLGLGLGALWGGSLAERIRDKITFYFIVEFLLGCFGLSSIFFLDFLGRATAGSSYFVSFFCMVAFLCIPTILMGITLPLLTKIFNSLIHNFLKSVSFLYFVNTLGAAVGSVCASYILISFFGLDISIYVAAAINLILAAMIFSVRYVADSKPIELYHSDEGKILEASLGTAAYLVVFVTGFLAIGYEIAWFRMIGVLVKDSPYAFSSILAVYLFGIALGSFFMNIYINRKKHLNSRNFFFIIQCCISLYTVIVCIGYFYLTKYSSFSIFTEKSFIRELHPDYMMLSFHSLRDSLWSLYAMLDVFFWPVIFMLIPTVLMGASFPLISFLALADSSKEGQTVGTVYFFNILGNVFGGIFTGFLLLPIVGTEFTLLTFSMIGMTFLLFVTSFLNNPMPLIKRVGITFILMVISLLFFPKRTELYEIMHVAPGKQFKMYMEEGIDGIIVTYQHQERVMNYINGLGHGARPGHIFYYEAIQAASFAQRLTDVLVIGYGTGSFVEVILNAAEVRDATLVELNQTLMKNLQKMNVFRDMLSNKRLNVIFDDGRRFLLRIKKKYDLIMMDPVRATTSYSNNLYSRQFFDLVSQHLNPGGIVLIWLDEYRVLPRTVVSSFKYVRLYNQFCLASNQPFQKNYEREKALLASFGSAEEKILKKLSNPLCRYLGDESYIRATTEQYPINQDRRPVCEYYLGLKIKEKLLRSATISFAPSRER